MMKMSEDQKWLRQQSKDFNAAGLDALVKRWEMCVSVGGGYGEKLGWKSLKKNCSEVT
jgi:hypothetical protein